MQFATQVWPNPSVCVDLATALAPIRDFLISSTLLAL